MATTEVSEHGRMSPDPEDGHREEPESGSRESTQSEAEDQEVVLEGDELFMTLTPEEEAAWREMMQGREAAVKSRKEEHAKWYDGFSRRRMFAYSRVRKLQEAFRKRAGFYGDISAYINEVETRAKGIRKPGTVKFQDSVVDGADSGQSAGDSGQQSSSSASENPQDQQQPQELADQQQGQQEKQQAGQDAEAKSEEETVTVKPLLRNAQ